MTATIGGVMARDMLDRMKRSLVLAVLISLIVVPFNIRLYLPREDANGLPRDALAQLAAMEKAVDGGAARDMQALFPEGYYFTAVLYGDAWLNVIARLPQNDPRYGKGLAEAAEALDMLDDPEAQSPFPERLDPPYGIFYVGWKTWLRGHRLSLMEPDSREGEQIAMLEAECELIAGALGRGNRPYLESYSGQAWPVDTVVAVAALSLCNKVLTAEYDEVIAEWEAEIRDSWAVGEDGLIMHRMEPQRGLVIDGARGSSQSVINRFLPEIDPEWAADTYPVFQDEFIAVPLGVREFPRGVIGFGDVDSGPLLFGVSASATVVGIGAARVNRDQEMARALMNGAEAVGVPIQFGGEKRYGLGLMPIGDLFLLWSKTGYNVVYEAPAPIEASLTPLWRLPYHVGSAVLMMLPMGVYWIVQWIRRRGQGRVSDPPLRV